MGRCKIVPALLDRTETGLNEKIQLTKSWKTPIHLDIVDGVFARPKSAAGESLRALPKGSEVHLMVRHPSRWTESLERWKPTTVILHQESLGLAEMVTWCHRHRFRVRIALQTTTSIERLREWLRRAVGVHIMLVPLGSYGGTLQPEMMERVAYLHRLHPKLELSVDGGMNPETIRAVRARGASLVAVGSYIFSSPRPTVRWRQLNKQ